MAGQLEFFRSAVTGAFIKLQAAFPGIQQVGNGNINGIFKAGARLVHGAGVVSSRADNTWPVGAVELQSAKSSDVFGARGQYSAVLSGQDNQAHFDRDVVVGGLRNTAESYYGYATVLNGRDNMAGATGAVALGPGDAFAWINGQIAIGLDAGGGGYARSGYMQNTFTFYKKLTTDASTQFLTSDGLDATLPVSSPPKNFISLIQGDKNYGCKITVLAKQVGSPNSKMFTFEGILAISSGVGTWAQMSSNTLNNGGSSASWTVNVDFNDGVYGAGLLLVVTGAAATNINWLCRIEALEIGF